MDQYITDTLIYSSW